MATFNVLVTPFDWTLDALPSQWVVSEEDETFDEMVGRLEYDVVKQAVPPHAAYLVTSKGGEKMSLILTNTQLLTLVEGRMRDEVDEDDAEDDDEAEEGEGGSQGVPPPVTL